MFGLQVTVAIGLLMVLYVIYRALMHSEIRSVRMMGKASGAAFAILFTVMVLVLRPMVLDSAVITSDSMEPTLLINDMLFTEKSTYRHAMPRHGDIITFSYPSRTPGLDDDILIKRVIGVPGDTIEVKNGAVFRNDTRLNEPYIATPPEYIKPKMVVKSGTVFVLGDNRNESDDSHVWGLLDRKRVVGRAIFRFWPMSRIGAIR